MADKEKKQDDNSPFEELVLTEGYATTVSLAVFLEAIAKLTERIEALENAPHPSLEIATPLVWWHDPAHGATQKALTAQWERDKAAGLYRPEANDT